MAASDVIAQDGNGIVKLHPYVVTLVRWCVSCVWSAATLLLHRLVTSPLPQIAAPKLQAASAPKPPTRPASSGHLHPEPLVDCVVLHQPESPADVDFVFVHGLYGSLENTWRQGDWRSKYKFEPNRVPLKRPCSIPSPCICEDCTSKNRLCIRNINTQSVNKGNISDDDDTITNVDGRYFNGNLDIPIQKVIPNDEVFITEKFYNNTMLNQVEIVDNFEIQAQFIRDLFGNECDSTKIICDGNEAAFSNKGNIEMDPRRDCKEVKYSKMEKYICECKECDDSNGKRCEVGCGCVCDECYSPCWPRDWLREDFPDARIISVNYTSDPYLWRPLWVKKNKRLRLHERAEQMTRQLLDLGVGERPIVWVGHSKGGLFIKQIYCEAYEAHLKETTTEKNPNEKDSRLTDGNLPINHNNASSIHKQNVAEDDDSKLVERNQKENSHNYCDKIRSTLWSNSAGFMFYSVPHRGSPLADIKTPITARSIELLEISKDNSLVLSLQERWLRATEFSKPVVRSLVETKRTLMSVLWLKIVSVESADAGIGALCGISVDHREICKPSSRSCILYRELTNLIQASIDRWR